MASWGCCGGMPKIPLLTMERRRDPNPAFLLGEFSVAWRGSLIDIIENLSRYETLELCLQTIEILTVLYQKDASLIEEEVQTGF